MRSHVIDSSALVKLVIPEEYSGILRGIITLHYESDVRLIAPEFVLVECANVLWKHTRRNDLPIETGMSAIRTLRGLGIGLVSQSGLLEDSLLFAANTGVTVYDALFCVLALQEDAGLITADARLVNRIGDTGVRALTLDAWPAQL